MLIEGHEILCRYGESILDAAGRAGVFIPSFCYDAKFLHNESCCRICMVEATANGATRVVPACSTTAANDMVVLVNTERIQRLRATILRLMWAQACGNETIRDIMNRYGVSEDPQIPVKTGRGCILCGKCVKACGYWMHGAIGSMRRGTKRTINTPYEQESAECMGCTVCEMVCPIHAIEHEDAGGVRTIWNNRFALLYCERCGKLVTTKENYYDSYFADAPVLCHECSEEYRKSNRADDNLYYE
ncbi:ferredoxin [Deltaproteobacteria bacterium]|nr:ferredoxin [Deltaproteobacteria bacterium]